jgi:tRNA(Ile)-lysidine synthase TilS/MesJ
MSLFYNGKLWSMKAHYKNEDGDLRIIRPFVYVREKDLRAFAEGNKLPIIPENCPGCFEAPKERQRMKQLLAQQEVQFPNLFSSLMSAIKPIISIDKTKISIKTLSEYGLKLVREDEKLYEELFSKNKADIIEASSNVVDLGGDLYKD